VILVTHENDIAGYARRLIRMRDGVIVADEPVAAPRDAVLDISAGAGFLHA
jgi:putative ABC transport system ATP-binding protein